ncbi:MAG: hypothetical protein FJ271_33965, partial [Planctomycetes bacterium]|nr:hypothetical protein [Planctomycetota bacterium]
MNTLEVKSAAVSLPTTGAAVDIVGLVPRSVGECLQAKDAFSLPPEERPETLPGCLMNISYEEWMRLLRRMLDNGMVTLVPARRLPTWRGRTITAGLFGVPKPPDHMRLIVDRRRQNALEMGLLDALRRRGTDDSEIARIRTLARLPHGGMWGDMILGPGDQLSINLDDLKDYYYLLRWPEPLASGSAVGPPLALDDLAVLGVEVDANGHVDDSDEEADLLGWMPLRKGGGATMYAALRTPAMGDAKVPDIAQLAHQHVLRTAGLLQDEDWMLYGRPPPAAQSWQGVYVDDHAT